MSSVPSIINAVLNISPNLPNPAFFIIAPANSLIAPLKYVPFPMYGCKSISSKYFKKLPQNLSRLLTVSFDKAMTDLTSALREQNQEAINLLRDSGLTIIPVPKGAALEEFYRVHDQVARINVKTPSSRC